MKFTIVSFIISVMLCCPISQLHAQYLGGNGDGYATLKSPNSLLDGSTPPNIYAGGSGDGYALLRSSDLLLSEPDSADLKVFKNDGPDPIVVGDTLTYTICVVNSGPDTARSVTVNDTLPAGVSLLTAFPDQGSCSFVSGTISCGLGDIGEGDTVRVSIEVMVEQTGVITNTACAESETADPDASNNCAAVQTEVLPLMADLKVFKNDGPDPIVLGDTLTYTICVVNLWSGYGQKCNHERHVARRSELAHGVPGPG